MFNVAALAGDTCLYITITHDSVELMNAIANQRRPDESSLRPVFCSLSSLTDWILLSGEFSHQKSAVEIQFTM